MVLKKFNSENFFNVKNHFNFTLILVLTTLFIQKNSYAQAGLFGVNDGTTILPFPIIKTTDNSFSPFVPISFNDAFNLELAKNYIARKNRAILYGGNFCVSQETGNFGQALGKWSFMGAHTLDFSYGLTIPFPPNTQQLVIPGINYLVDYHRWGNYDAFFGLRERASDVGIYNYENGGNINIPPNPQGDIKDAVITWSYERNQTPSRLIFQSIDGILPPTSQPQNMGVTADVTEHATILHNGNMGLGTDNPMAHLEIKSNPIFPNTNPLNVVNSINSSILLINSNGKIGINNNTPQEALDVNGNVKILGDINLDGDYSYHKTRFQINQPNNYISGQHLLRITNGAKDFLNVYNGGILADVSQFSVSSDNVYFNNSNTFEAHGKTTFKIPNTIGFPLNKAFDIQYQTSGNSLMYFQNDGQMYLKGSAYAYTPNTGIDYGLFLDPNGKVYVDNVLPTNKNNFWMVGGNQFSVGGSSQNFGTTNNNNIKLIANNIHAGTIIGNNANKLGFLEYIKPVAFGGSLNVTYPSANEDYAVTIKSTIPGYSTGGFTQGVLNCEDYLGNSVFRVGNYSVGLAGHSFTYGLVNIESDVEVNGNIKPSAQSYDLGDQSNPWIDVFGLNAYTQTSDLRHKTNILNLPNSLNKILKLRPVSYNWKINNNGKRLGFIAQEVEKILPEVVTKDSLGNYGMRYSEIIPLLTKGIQDQQEIIDTLRQQINLLIYSNKRIETIDNLEQKEVLNQLPFLFQNHPNPFNGSTFIDYFLPPIANNAFIRVVDNNGKLIKAFQLQNKGYGQVELDCRNLSAGTYHYSLLVDTKVIETKSMVVLAEN